MYTTLKYRAGWAFGFGYLNSKYRMVLDLNALIYSGMLPSKRCPFRALENYGFAF